MRLLIRLNLLMGILLGVASYGANAHIHPVLGIGKLNAGFWVAPPDPLLEAKEMAEKDGLSKCKTEKVERISEFASFEEALNGHFIAEAAAYFRCVKE